jgi:hypothetical protein
MTQIFKYCIKFLFCEHTHKKNPKLPPGFIVDLVV